MGIKPGILTNRSRRAEAGFTLAEVLVAVFVVALLAAALFQGYFYGFSIVLRDRADLRANQIMLQKIEGIRLCRWDQLANLTFVDRYDPSGATTNTLAGGTVYTGTVSFGSPTNIIPQSADYYPDMYLVTVSIRWTNYIGKQSFAQTRQMQTLVARYGLQNYIFGVSP